MLDSGVERLILNGQDKRGLARDQFSTWRYYVTSMTEAASGDDLQSDHLPLSTLSSILDLGSLPRPYTLDPDQWVIGYLHSQDGCPPFHSAVGRTECWYSMLSPTNLHFTDTLVAQLANLVFSLYSY